MASQHAQENFRVAQWVIHNILSTYSLMSQTMHLIDYCLFCINIYLKVVSHCLFIVFKIFYKNTISLCLLSANPSVVDDSAGFSDASSSPPSLVIRQSPVGLTP